MSLTLTKHQEILKVCTQSLSHWSNSGFMAVVRLLCMSYWELPDVNESISFCVFHYLYLYLCIVRSTEVCTVQGNGVTDGGLHLIKWAHLHNTGHILITTKNEKQKSWGKLWNIAQREWQPQADFKVFYEWEKSVSAYFLPVATGQTKSKCWFVAVVSPPHS